MLDRSVDLVELGPFMNMMWTDDAGYEAIAAEHKNKTIYDLASFTKPGPRESDDAFSTALAEFAGEYPDFTFCEVGAQYGSSTMETVRFFRHIGTEPAVFAFEPGTAAPLTPINFENNGFGEITFERAAIGPVDGWAILHRELGHSEDNRIVNPVRDRNRGSTSYPVRCWRLDTYLERAGRFGPLAAKIDTQGAEPGVLSGMARLMETQPVLMLMEYTPWAISPVVEPADFLRKLMRTHSVFDVHLNEEVTNPEDHRDYVNSSTARWTDLLLKPRQT